MTLAEYRRFYLDLTLGVLGGNHAHFAITMPYDTAQKAEYDNYRRGLLLLTLVSLAEANLISDSDFKALRKFEPATAISSTINQTHLSGFIYLRDCVAHNPATNLLSGGKNTAAFRAAVAAGQFPFVSVTGTSLTIKNTHELHLIVLRLYGENV
jgi:hypothetical protein